MEYHRSPQDNALGCELWTLSTKILLDKAQSRLDSATKIQTNKDILDDVLKQNGFSNASTFEETLIHFHLAPNATVKIIPFKQCR
jgi:hypothetical protein